MNNDLSLQESIEMQIQSDHWNLQFHAIVEDASARKKKTELQSNSPNDEI
jgi:hypothetical protein